MPDFEIKATRADVTAIKGFVRTNLKVELEGVDIGALIDAVGQDELLDAIGRDECVKYFDLTLADE